MPVTNGADTQLHDLPPDDAVFAIDTYLEDTSLQLRAMKEALVRHDLRFLARAARQLGHGSRRVSAVTMSSLARELMRLANTLERRSRSGEANVVSADVERDLASLLDRLKQEYDAIGPILAGYLYEKVTAARPAHAEGARSDLARTLTQRLLGIKGAPT